MRKLIFSLTLLVTGTLAFSQTTLTIKADKDAPQISRDIYGHFAEHLGRCVYGGFYVGDAEQIPNTDGVRNDVIKALKDLKVPVLRWPGGCFADTYHWKDGIGKQENRPTIVNQWWGGVTEDNSFGTHNFLNMCEEIGAEPYLAANMASGTVQELIDWVQYVNHDKVSPMADLRRANGRDEPWNVKYWGVGNEAWGCGGNMTPEYYSDLYRKYATFMSGWSNEGGVFRIASGAASDDYHWTEVLMKNVPSRLIEGVALHHYSVISWKNKGSDTDFTEEQYFTTMKQAYKMEELVTRHAEIMDKYDPEKKIALVVDEWGGWYQGDEEKGVLYQQNTMRDAMIAGLTLNIFHNHADRVRMANLAQTINVLQAVILTDEEKMILTPTYHVMKMYNVHQDATLLPVDLNTPMYTLGDQSLPAVSVSASKDSEGVIHISMVNIDSQNSQPVSVAFAGSAGKKVTGTILKSDKIQNYNSFEAPDAIQPSVFKGAKMKGDEISVSLPPFSVVLLEIK